MNEYRIFGAELSPYSVKVRSWFRHKGLPHRWIVRSPKTQADFQRYARLPLVPLVVTPENEGMQDSTPIIERLDKRHPEPESQPADPMLAFLSALIEEYADEWVNKPMFHYRWWREEDRRSAAERIAQVIAGPDAASGTLAEVAASVAERMAGRLHFVGSSKDTKEVIEASFEELIDIVEAHLAERPFLFGQRPVWADFGLYAQLYEASIDPTAGALLRQRAPRILDWIERMLVPEPPEKGHELESWAELAPTLEPLLEHQIAGYFLPWSTANARGLGAGDESFSVVLRGRGFRQKPQKYHARSLTALRQRYADLESVPELDEVLERTGCRDWLAT